MISFSQIDASSGIIQLRGIANLVRVPQDIHHQSRVLRENCGDMLARTDDDFGDADGLRPPHDLTEEGVALTCVFCGLEIIRFVVIYGIDFGLIDEIGNLDRLRRLWIRALEIGVRYGNVFTFFVLVTFYNVVP